MIKTVTVNHVRAYKKDTGWFVMITEDDETVVGTSILPPSGEVTIDGEWSNNTKWGRQFKARKIIYSDTLEIIKALLASGFLTGIKQSKANAMIDALGNRCFEVLDACLLEPAVKLQWNGLTKLPEDILLGVNGVGPIVARQILEAWKARRGIMGVAILGIRAGLSAQQFRDALGSLGAEGLSKKILEDPYGLSMVDGFSWEDVDLIASLEWEGKSKIEHDSPARMGAALREAINRQRVHGHLAFPIEDAIRDAEMLADVPGIWDAVKDSLDALGLIPFANMLSTKNNYEMELRIAMKLIALMEHPVRRGDIDNINLAPFSDVILAEQQGLAVLMALQNKVSVIHGGPGTGKTTIIKTLLNALDHFDVSYVLAAPTGKAAIRMEEATGREAYTLHRFFELFREEKDRPQLAADYLVIDEFSMVSADLFDDVLKLIPERCHLVLVGDNNQLPPVGPGEPLTQLIRTGIPNTYLDVIFRQSETSGIVTAAHDIVRGKHPEGAQDFLILEKTREGAPLTDYHLAKRVVDGIHYLQEQGIPAHEIQVLTPLNGGQAGRVALNKLLQQTFNPSNQPIRGLLFKLGDRVIHTVNNYRLGVMNGEVGYVVKAEVVESGGELSLPESRGSEWDEDPEPVIWVTYPNRKDLVGYSRDDLAELSLAYALTVHKSQGSEYAAAICVFMHTRESFMLRQLAYTAVTRAKKICAVITVPGAFGKFIANATRVRRFSQLSTLVKSLQVGKEQI